MLKKRNAVIESHDLENCDALLPVSLRSRSGCFFDSKIRLCVVFVFLGKCPELHTPAVLILLRFAKLGLPFASEWHLFDDVHENN